jgi:hypothetical protein
MVDTLLSSNTFLPGLYQSANNICGIFTAIIESRGENWVDHVRTISWTDEEKQKFEHLFQPYLPHILAFFNGMKGGVEPGADADAELDAEPGTGTEPGAGAKTSSTSKYYTPDDIFLKIREALQYIDSTVAEIASDKGIMKFEKKADKEEDYPIIPSAAVALLEPTPLGPAAVALGQIKVPLRLLITLIYLFLDMSRMAAATAGQDQTRKVLSIAVALIDILRGDWKKGITSIMGYFGTAPLFMGQLAKTYLFLFQMLSPRIQDNFLFGVHDALKSFMIGVLLTIFKVTAPYEIRIKVIEVFETIAKHKKDIDGTLESADLNPLPEYMTPSFEDLNNLQALMDDPAFLCSKEHQELVKNINQSYMLRILLEMARIPVTEQFIKWKCDGKPARPFVEELADRQRKPNKKKNAAAAEASPIESSLTAETSATAELSLPASIGDDSATNASLSATMESSATTKPPALVEPSPTPATAELSPTKATLPASTGDDSATNTSLSATIEPPATTEPPALAEPSPATTIVPAASPTSQSVVAKISGGKRSLRMASAFIP